MCAGKNRRRNQNVSKRLEAILASLPPDAPARYEKNPPQPWDRKPGAGDKKARKRKKKQQARK